MQTVVRVVCLIAIAFMMQSCTICRVTTHEAVNAIPAQEIALTRQALIEVYEMNDVYYVGLPLQYIKKPTSLISVSNGQFPLARGWNHYPTAQRKAASGVMYAYVPLNREQVAMWNMRYHTHYRYKRFDPQVYAEDSFDKKKARLIARETESPPFLPILESSCQRVFPPRRSSMITRALSSPLYIVDIALTIPANALIWVFCDIPYNTYHMLLK